MKKRILFVCLGNICRSPAAEGVAQSIIVNRGLGERIEVDSAGTAGYHIGQQPDSRMLAACRRRGIALNHRGRRVTAADFDRFDVIVAMDDANFDDLRRIAPSPEAESRIVRMRDFFSPATARRYDYVPDPYYEGREGFELVLDLLEVSCGNLISSTLKS